jgi:hypothetical protein
MHRDERPMTLAYKGQSVTFPMPGWYCEASGESVHTGEDMKVSDRMLDRLRQLWAEGIASGPGRFENIAAIKAEARRRL